MPTSLTVHSFMKLVSNLYVTKSGGGYCAAGCMDYDSSSSCRDLSEQIKKVTKESHVRAENTELMLSFQRGKVTLQQYKVIQSNRT